MKRRGDRWTGRWVFAAVALWTAAAAGTATGQAPVPEIERVGSSDVALDRRLGRLLEAGPLVLLEDTVVAASDTLRGSVLVLDATLVLEGTVEGDLVLVDAGAFVRPGAVVEGDLVNMGGGLYRSQLARVGGVIIDESTAGYRVIREPDRIVIEALDSPSPVTLDEFFGFHVPTYDRVNGVTGVWGGGLRLPRIGSVTPSVHGQVGWMTERGEPTYGASIELRRFGTAVEAGYERGWATNEEWIRDDLRSSLNYLWDGEAFRDYYQAERSWVGLSQAFGDEEKSLRAVLGVRGQVEDASSLESGNPWHLLGDTVRSNPAVDDGRVTSLVADAVLAWRGRETQFDGGVEYEAGREWLDGERVFDRVTARGDWAMHAFANHTLRIEFFLQAPLGDDSLPRQRQTFVGGSGTLRTLERARYRGDHVVFVQSAYIVPLPERLAIPFLGAPEVQLIHAAGKAWLEGEDNALEQELGVRVDFFGVYVRYLVDPTDFDRTEFNVGMRLPVVGGYPWATR
ncbi:MAG: hypothetical protein P8177_10675 [Gemmatimonadota bacterium]